jgi:hypothetical protein
MLDILLLLLHGSPTENGGQRKGWWRVTQKTSSTRKEREEREREKKRKANHCAVHRAEMLLERERERERERV